MKRREVLAGICAASIWPNVGLAQQSTHRLAFVHSGIPADRLTENSGPFWVRRFYETLRGLGDVEGTNLIVERFSAEGRTDRFGPLAAEVIARKPQVIVTNLNDLVKAFMAATTSIPIVAVVGDPLAGGLVTNLARPGGNLTGVSINAGVAPDLGELAIRMANDVHQIFNGTKAGDIPFYQPSKFLLIFNLRTAKAMGLDLPVNLIARADEVIE